MNPKKSVKSAANYSTGTQTVNHAPLPEELSKDLLS